MRTGAGKLGNVGGGVRALAGLTRRWPRHAEALNGAAAVLLAADNRRAVKRLSKRMQATANSHKNAALY